MTSKRDREIQTNPLTALKEVLRSQNWTVVLILVLITGIACSPIYYHRIALPVDTDYGGHIIATQQLLAGNGLPLGHLSHPVLQLVLAAMHLASGRLLGLYASLMVLQVMVQIFTALIIYFWIGHADRKYWDFIRAGIAFSLTFVAPVMLLAFRDGQFYFGYIGLANYHNPTIHLLKPFALLSFIYAIRALTVDRNSPKSIGLCAVLVIITALIKPNYLISILPALALVIGIRWLQKRSFDWKMLLYGFYIPGLMILIVQWLIAYQVGNPGNGIIFAPFVVESAFSQSLVLKFLLSAIFPLSVLLINRRKLLSDPELLVGWAGFLAGTLQVYLLAESGAALMFGNFRWSGQIMLFLLFVVAARYVLKEMLLSGGMKLWEKIVLYGTYLAQFSGGIAYYIYCMISIHYS
jgi:hypothetical protein